MGCCLTPAFWATDSLPLQLVLLLPYRLFLSEPECRIGSSTMTKGSYSAPYAAIRKHHIPPPEEPGAAKMPALQSFLKTNLQDDPLFMYWEEGSAWCVLRRPVTEDTDVDQVSRNPI